MKVFDWLQLLDNCTRIKITDTDKDITIVGDACNAFRWFDLSDFIHLWIDGDIRTEMYEGEVVVAIECYRKSE